MRYLSFGICFVCFLVCNGCVLSNPTNPYAALELGQGFWLESDPTKAVKQTTLPDGPLDLKEAVRIALLNNPEIAAGNWDALAVAAQRDIVEAQRLPSLHVTSGYNYYLDSQRLIPARKNKDPGVFSRNIFASDIVASLPLFTGGRITNEVKAAELLEKTAEHRLIRSRQELVFKVSNVFYTILAQRHLIESLEFSLKTLQEHLKKVNELIAQQKATNVDRLRIEVRLADLKQKLVRERNIQAIQYRILATLLGVGDNGKTIEISEDLFKVEVQEVPDIEAVLATALKNRGDYLAARSALEAQAASVDAARAMQWPTVSLSATYGGRWAIAPTERAKGVDTAGDVGRIGLFVDIPVFEGGRIEARIRQERAKLSAAQERMRNLQLQIRLEVEASLLNIKSSQERVQTTEKTIEQAKEVLRIEQEKYELGKGSITDVLDAQSALLEAQMNYYRALADLNIAIAQMKLSIGENLK